MEQIVTDKKKKRIAGVKISVLVMIAVIIAALIGVAKTNGLITKAINQKLQEQSTAMQAGSFSYGGIDVNLWKATAIVKDLRYVSDSSGVKNTKLSGFEIGVRETEFYFLEYWSLLKNKKLVVHSVTLNDIESVLKIDDSRPVIPKDSTDTGTMDVYKTVLEFVATINVSKVNINNASLVVDNIGNSFHFQLDSTYLNVTNLGYDIAKGKVSYNDSIYAFSVKNIKMIHPDGKYRMEVAGVHSANAGPLIIDNISHKCLIDKEKLAVVNGKIPVVWSNLTINKIKTSNVNIIRSILNEDVNLESVSLSGGFVDLYKDDTYPPVKVSRPIQVSLAKLMVPLNVKRVNVSLDKFWFTEKLANAPAATLKMNNVKASVRDVNNVDYKDIVAKVSCSMDSRGGYMTMDLRLHKNEQSTWDFKFGMTDGKFGAFNDFLGNLAGVRVSGDLEKVEAVYSGDTLKSKGTFVLLYKNLEAEVIKGKSPFDILNKTSKAVNGLIKVIVPHSNPLKPGAAPKEYKVSAKRDLYKPYFVYIMGGVFNGLEETLLAPFFLAKEVKEDSALKKERKSSYEERKEVRKEKRQERKENRQERKEKRKERKEAKRSE